MAIAKEQLRQIISQNDINSVSDIYSLFRDSFKDMLLELLEAEMEASIGYSKNEKDNECTANKRNGYSAKTVKSQYGEIPLEIPRDRHGEFEPQTIPKHQRNISGIEEKIISLYARGMTTRDIHDQIEDLYGIQVSADMASKITDKILPDVKKWQTRPLDSIYTFCFLDAVHYSCRDEGRIVKKAAYVALGVRVDGTKDILSITTEIRV